MSNERDARRRFDQTIAGFRAEIAAVAAHGAIDGQARLTYNRLIDAMSRELAREASAGRITWQVAAERAHAARNATMGVIRQRSTPVGRAFAERIKREGRTLNALIARYTQRLHGASADFNRLSNDQRNQVYRAVVEAAGRSDPQISAWMRRLSTAGRGLLIASIAFSVYNVATAEDQAAAAGREGAVLGSGIVGGIAGGAAAGLLCGPGAPVCVTVGAFVGGTLAAFGVSFLW